MKRHSHSRGQAAVEFAVFMVTLIFLLMLLIQLAWIGIQKWQFNHFASYAARSWAVDKKNTSPETMLTTDLAWGLDKWKPPGLVKLITSEGQTEDNDGHSGIKYLGHASTWSLFDPYFPATGLEFESFVPMIHEPPETPGTYDNDCSDPCDDNAR